MIVCVLLAATFVQVNKAFNTLSLSYLLLCVVGAVKLVEVNLQYALCLLFADVIAVLKFQRSVNVNI